SSLTSLFSYSLPHPSPSYIYTLSLHDALPILILQEHAHGGLADVVVNRRHLLFDARHGALDQCHDVGLHRHPQLAGRGARPAGGDRKSTRLNSSHVSISYAVFCLKKKKKDKRR